MVWKIINKTRLNYYEVIELLYIAGNKKKIMHNKKKYIIRYRSGLIADKIEIMESK